MSLSKTFKPTDRLYVIDDDFDVAESICFMTGSLGLHSGRFSNQPDFLRAVPHLQPGCILQDVQMPGISYPMIQSELRKLGSDWSVVFMSGSPAGACAAAAAGEEAPRFLAKPFVEDELLHALRESFERLGSRSSSKPAG